MRRAAECEVSLLPTSGVAQQQYGGAAAARGLPLALVLDCEICGSGNKKCLCSNVGGKTAEECELFPNPGWKCCTCKSLRQPDTGSDGDPGPTDNTNQGQGDENKKVKET